MMTFKKLGVSLGTLAVAIAVSGGAMAQQPIDEVMFMDSSDRGWYLSGGLGVHHPHDSDVEGTGINSSVEIDQGLAGLVGVGYDYGSSWRTEIEGTYRGSDVDKVSGVNGTGEVDAYSAMVNLFYDFDFGGGVEPYIGGGLGMSQVSVDSVGPIGGSSVDDDDWGYAFQLGAGLAVPLNNRIKLTADYRFLSVQDLSYNTAAGTSVDGDYDDHAIFLGVRFALNPPAPAPQPIVQAVAPAPAPQPAPAPAPAPEVVVRDFLIFFDFDSAVVTPPARAILEQAVVNARSLGNVRIVTTGHTDLSGSAAYNQGLSQRRADAVRAELVRLGLTGYDIQTVARGESDPLVATPDGVREPQNRRVQIVF